MTAALDLHPTPGHPAVVAAAVHEVLDGVDLAGQPGFAAGDYGAAVPELARARSRIRALELKLVAAAERASVPRKSGARSTGAWLARQTRSGQAECSRDTKLARALDRGLPATGSALGEGAVSDAHARVIADAVTKLPVGLSRDQVATVEARLVDKAKRSRPPRITPGRPPCPRRRRARRGGRGRPRGRAGCTTRRQRALARTRLTLHDNNDGTTSGHFTVPTLAASILKKVLDTMTSPRRGRLGAGAQAGDQNIDRDPAHDRGLAFTSLLERLPTDHLHGKVAATVIVTLDRDTLTGQLKAAGLDTGDLVSASEARRLVCNAGLVPAVLNGHPSLRPRTKQTPVQRESTPRWCAHPTPSARPTAATFPTPGAELHHQRAVVPRRTHRPRPDGPPVRVPPPTHPRQRLSPSTTTRRQPALHSAT